MSTYSFAGAHPTAEEVATAAMSAHPNTPVRIDGGVRYNVELRYITTTAAQVTAYAAVSDKAGPELIMKFREQLHEARESLESALKEAYRLTGPSTLTDERDDGSNDLSVTVRVETARIQEDLGNLRDTLNALRSTIEEWAL